MAGRNHHIIPQMLLRGFGKQTGKKTFRLIAHFKGGKRISVNTDGIAAERDFYSKLVDDNITDYESNVLSNLLKAFCSYNFGSTVDNQRAAEFVNHFVVRNAESRNQYKLLFEKMFDRIVDEKVFNIKFLIKLAGLHNRRSPFSQIILYKLHQEFPQIQKWGKVFSFITEHLVLLVIRVATPRFLEKKLALDFENMKDSWKKSLSEGVHRGFSQQLEKNLLSDHYKNVLSRFSWTVEKAPSEGAILPDCVVLFKSKWREWGSDFEVVLSKVTAVYMPLTADKILVGKLKKGRLNLHNINRFAALSSLNFFLSSPNTSVSNKMTLMIGQKAERVCAKVINQNISDFKKLLNQIINGVAERFKDFDLNKHISDEALALSDRIPSNVVIPEKD